MTEIKDRKVSAVAWPDLRPIQKLQGDNSLKGRAGKWFHKTWTGHKWLMEQPEFGKGKDNMASVIVYVLFLLIACFPIYDIWFYKNTYTDVQSKYPAQAPILMPHAVICPKLSSCSSCQQLFRDYEFKFAAFWDHRILELLNLSNKQVNLIASLAHREAFGGHVNVPDEILSQLRIVKGRTQGIAHEKYNDSLSFRQKTKILFSSVPTTTVSHIWNTLIDDHQIYFHLISRKELLQPAIIQPIQPTFIWVNNAFCQLYQTQGFLINTTKQFLKMKLPVEARYWIGSLTSELLHYDDMYVATETCNLSSEFPPIMRQFHEIETVSVKDHTVSTVKQVCQKHIGHFHIKECSDAFLPQYALHILHATSLRLRRVELSPSTRISGNPNAGNLRLEDQKACPSHMTIEFNFNSPNWHIHKKNVYTWLVTTEIMMGVACFFLGFSFYQILSLSLFFGKWLKSFKSYKLKIVIVFILCIFTVILLVNDLHDLFSPSFVQKVSIGSSLAMPSLRITPMYTSFLNFSKIEGLNVSFALLHYIFIASTMNVMGQLDMGIRNRIFDRKNFLTLEFLKKVNQTDTCASEISKLHLEYNDLAGKLDVNSSSPAFNVFEQLHIDKCRLIVSCSLNGQVVRNCCKSFVFALHYANGQLSPVFVLENRNRRFKFADNGKPDIAVVLNLTKATSEAYAFERLVRNTYFHKLSQLDIEKAIKRTFGEINYWVNFDFGIVPQSHSFFRAGRIGITKVAHQDEISLSYQYISEFSEEIKGCVNTTACVMGVKPLVSSRHVGFSAKNMNVYLNCGCFVCFNGMNLLMAKKDKCCSPKEALDCIVNPLNHVESTDLSRCRKSDVICSYSVPHSDPCSAMLPSKLLDIPRFRYTMTKRFDRYHMPFFQYHPRGEHGSILDRIRHSLFQFGCGNLSDHNPQLCFNAKQKYLSKKFLPHKTISTKVLGGLNTIHVKVARESILNNYITSRTNRQYTILEALGICLGGIGLFLGIDILCLIESIINYVSARNQTRLKKIEAAFVPVHEHLLRMFNGMNYDHSKQEDLTEGIGQDNSSRNINPKDQKYVDGFEGQSTEQHNPGMENGFKPAIFCMGALLLYVSGIGISTYVASSTLLSATEYNLEVAKQQIGGKYPSVAICRTAVDSAEKSLKIPWNDQHSAFLKRNVSKCWVEMNEVQCHRLFEHYIFTGSQHCWLTDENSSYFKVTKLLRQHTEFMFLIAIHKSILLKEHFYIWFGNLQHALTGRIHGEIWKGNSFISRAYQVLKNSSCTSEFNVTACPRCHLVNSKSSCCIEHVDGRIDTKPIGKQEACEKIFKEVKPTGNSMEAAFQSSQIFQKYYEYFKKELHMFYGLRMSTPFVFTFSEIPRHSVGAKFAIVSGYIDLFLGISIVAFGGAVLLWLWRKLRNIGSNIV